jgi:hypothetical protein
MMMTALPFALKKLELPLYEAWAVGDAKRKSGDDLRPEFRPRETDVATIVSAVQRKNTDIMGEWR